MLPCGQIRDEMGNNRTQEDVVVAQLRLRTVRGLPPPTELEQQIVTTGVVTSLGRGLYNGTSLRDGQFPSFPFT